MKIRIIKAQDGYAKGQVVEIRTKEGLDLVKRGVAKVDRMYDTGKEK
jgi:hypothetical protein